MDFNVRELNVAIELWGVAFCLMAIACTLVLLRAEPRYRRYVLALFSCELVCAAGDAVAGIFRGQPGELAWTMTHAGNLLTFLAGFLLTGTFTSYVCRRVEDSGGGSWRSWRLLTWTLCTCLCVATICGAFYTIDGQNLYRRSSWYWVSAVTPAVISFGDAVVVLRSRQVLSRATFGCLLLYLFGPAAAACVQASVYGLNFIIVVVALGLVVLLLEMQASAANALVRRTEDLAAARLDVAESRMAAMVSQIQPHFIFNSLDTIYALIYEDPDLAGETLVSFSRYLRANLDSLGRTAPIPIEAELEHVRTYLELERAADEDKIAYEIDARAGGFFVPALSVQILAENAVKHGVAASERGGCVRVSTREVEDGFEVSVEDDGVGFDAGFVPTEEGHVGIANTRERLAIMCEGTLEVTSEPGAGTTAVMFVPKTHGGRLTE